MSRISQKLQQIYDGKEPAMVGIERLVRNSSTLANALKICRAGIDPKIQEMLAQTFLNCYCAGFVAGINFTKEAD